MYNTSVHTIAGSQFEIHKQDAGNTVKQRYCNDNKPVGNIISSKILRIQFYFNAGPHLIAVDGFKGSYRIIPMENQIGFQNEVNPTSTFYTNLYTIIVFSEVDTCFCRLDKSDIG